MDREPLWERVRAPGVGGAGPSREGAHEERPIPDSLTAHLFSPGSAGPLGDENGPV